MGTVHQTDFLQALGWAVLNSLWQMALLWILYQLIFSVYTNAKPGIKASAASLLLFAGFGWFIITLLSLLYGPYQSVYSISGLLSPDSVQQHGLIKLLPAATIVYLVLLVFPLFNFIRNYRYVHLVRSTGLVKADVQWRIFTRNIAAHMGISQPVKVWISELVNSPVTIGYLKPVILLPVAALNQLTPAQTEAILLHELAHIRRHDFLINLCCRIIRTILYFNPFVKAFSTILEKEREQHCDEMVMQFQYDRHSYASALLILEQSANARHRLALAAAQGKKNELLHRIELIMGIHQKKRFSLHKFGGIIATLLLLLTVNALLHIGKPVRETDANGLVADIYSPLYFSDNTGVTSASIAATTSENIGTSVINHAAATTEKPSAVKLAEQPLAATNKTETNTETERPLPPSAYQYVAGTSYAPQELNKEEAAQVKEAMALSKRVLEEVQWKTVEADIADALNSLEKAEMKEVYQEATTKVTDWEKMETKLRAAYDQINWNEVNAQLNQAMTTIKLDSLQQVYTIALSSLGKIQKEMETAKQKSIPDSDINTRTIEIKKKDLLEAIKRISTIRNRKVVKI